MKKLLTLALTFALALGVQAQYVEFHKKDGSKQKYATLGVSSINVAKDVFKTATINKIDGNTESVYLSTVDSILFVDSDTVLNGYEAVDLGLPSGLLWATCNVGADTPEQYGTYFSWGEVSPKDTYSWSTYKWGTAKNVEQTKYNSLDSKKDLDTEDDAASVNWGGSWRMPYPDEFIELRENCTTSNDTINGVIGIRMTSNLNGKSIFIPFGGYIDSSGPYLVGDYGMLWTKSKYFASKSEGVTLGYAFDFFARAYNEAAGRTEGVYYEWTDRCYGENIRPVCDNNITRPAAESIALDQHELTLMKRATAQLVKTILPEDALQAAVWTSTDENVATVSSNGLVTGVGAGEAWIKVSPKSNPALVDSCKVTIEKQQPPVETGKPYYIVHSESGLYLSLDILTGAAGTSEQNVSLQEVGNASIVYVSETGYDTYYINTAVDATGKYLGGIQWNCIPTEDAFAWEITKTNDGKYNLYQSNTANTGYLKADPVTGPWSVGAATYCNYNSPVAWEFVPATATVWSVETTPAEVGGIVLTGGKTVANGGKFAFEGTPVYNIDFTAVTDILGYELAGEPTVDVENTKISVSYNQVPITYTVEVTGSEDGGILLLADSVEVKNNGTFAFTGVPVEGVDFNVIEIDTLNCQATVTGDKVYVTYTEPSSAYYIQHVTSGLYLSLTELTGANEQENNVSLQNTDKATPLYVIPGDGGLTYFNTKEDGTGDYLGGERWNVKPWTTAFGWTVAELTDGTITLYQNNTNNPGYLKSDKTDVGSPTYCDSGAAQAFRLVSVNTK